MNKGVILNIISVLIMSLAPLINKFSLSFINPIQASFLNAAFALFFSFCYAKIRKEKIQIIKNKYIWLIGIFNALGLVSLYKSLNFLSPITVGFIGRFYVVFAILLSIIMLREKFRKKEAFLVSLAIIGTFLFAEKDNNLTNILGIIYAFSYTFFFALTNTLVKITVTNVSSNTILFYNNGISAIFIFLYMFLNGEFLSLGFNINGISLIFISAFLNGFLGLLLFYEGLRYINFSLANIIRSTGPIVVAIYSWSFFPIDLDIYKVMGIVLLLSSVILLSNQTGK